MVCAPESSFLNVMPHLLLPGYWDGAVEHRHVQRSSLPANGIDSPPLRDPQRNTQGILMPSDERFLRFPASTFPPFWLYANSHLGNVQFRLKQNRRAGDSRLLACNHDPAIGGAERIPTIFSTPNYCQTDDGVFGGWINYSESEFILTCLQVPGQLD